MQCETTGVLDRIEEVAQFTRLKHPVALEIGRSTHEAKTERLAEKADSIGLNAIGSQRK